MKISIKSCPRVLLAYAGLLFLTSCTHHLAFNTETKIGLDISQSADQMPQFTFGYQRAACVVFPVAPTNHWEDSSSTNDSYSVIGTCRVAFNPWLVSGDAATNGGVHINQFFATGIAAQLAATNPSLAQVFGSYVGELHSRKLSKRSSTNSPAATNAPVAESKLAAAPKAK